LQEILELPADRWDFDAFYSENPDADRFLCKVLVAGAVAIYLDIMAKKDAGQTVSKSQKKDCIERVIHLFNAFLEESSWGNGENPAGFDPFGYDEYLGDAHVDEGIRKEYSERVTELFTAFRKQFEVCNCQDILGFDPFRYDEYDEEMQEIIEEGEWIQKCVECMQFIIKIIYR